LIVTKVLVLPSKVAHLIIVKFILVLEAQILIVHLQIGIKVFDRQLTLRCLVHITKTTEAATHGASTILIKMEAAPCAHGVFNFPVA